MGDEPAGMVLRGGMVVSTATRELYPADVVISGERIAGSGRPGEYPSGAAEEVDLDGRFVALASRRPHRELQPHGDRAGASDRSAGRAVAVRGRPRDRERARLPGIELFLSKEPRCRSTCCCGAWSRACASGRLETSGHEMDLQATLICSTDRTPCASAVTSTPRCCSAPTRNSWPRSRPPSLGARRSAASSGFTGRLWTPRSSAESRTRTWPSPWKRYWSSSGAVCGCSSRLVSTGFPPRSGRRWSTPSELLMRTPAIWSCAATTSIRTSSNQGHLDHRVRLAVAAGFDPVEAIQMATSTAEHLRVDRDLGSVAPGSWPTSWCSMTSRRSAYMVLHHGRIAAKSGRLVDETAAFVYPSGRGTRFGWSPLSAPTTSAAMPNRSPQLTERPPCGSWRSAVRRPCTRLSCGWRGTSYNPTLPPTSPALP